MKAGQESFSTLIDEAYVGRLRLPAFQREWAWRLPQVVSLFDSIRKNYPIGGFLFLKVRPDFDLSPRPFHPFKETSSNLTHEIERYVLDGQQRITAGLTIYKGVGDSQLFLDLGKLWDTVRQKKLDLQDSVAVRTFADDLDDEDAYCVARKVKTPATQIKKHLFWTAMLSDETDFQKHRDEYVKEFKDRAKFMDYLIRPHFRLGSGIMVPVTTLDHDESIEATTKIFATLNTTGKPLTPFEIVVARLFSSNFMLVKDVEDNKEASTYYKNMDQTGEIYLQTIALLARADPKKARLPRTITAERYRAHHDKAVDLLENLGQFLTERLGIGLNMTSALTPYDSIFPPMAITYNEIENKKLKGSKKLSVEQKIERWFVTAALDQRYQEGVHNKQTTDVTEMSEWLNNDKAQPSWIRVFKMPTLLGHSPLGAVGRLLQLLMNRDQPSDPLTHSKVGYSSQATVKTELHHIFPRKFCEDHIPDWGKQDNANQALNVMFTDSETNKLWTKMDPANQMDDIERANKDVKSRKAMLLKHAIDDNCVEIMKRPNKKKADFDDFLKARARVFEEKFSEWDIKSEA